MRPDAEKERSPRSANSRGFQKDNNLEKTLPTSAREVKAAALDYLRRGMSVIPIKARDKRPAVKWEEFQHRLPTEAEIEEWFTRWPDANLGLVTGSISGVIAVDADGPQGVEWIKRNLPRTTVYQRTSQGWHAFYRQNGTRVRNSVRLAPEVDVRGDGGYVCIAPSIHPSGSQYELEIMGGGWDGLADYPAIEAQTAAPAREAVPESGPIPQGQRDDTLTRMVGHWFHKGLARDEVLALARAMNQERCRPPLPDADVVRIVGSIGKRDQAQIVPPVEFDEGEPVPITPDMVPGLVGEFAQAVAASVQVPFELPLVNVLGAVAIACQRKARVQVNGDYSEPLSLYAMVALPPGERKSSTVEACKRPLVLWQRDQARAMKDIIDGARSERLTLEEAIKHKRTQAAKAPDAEQRRQLSEEVKALERDLPEIPAAPRLLADDVTPEALAEIMAQQHQRIGIMEAEGGLLDTLGGRYSNGTPNLDLVLKAWSGEPVTVDRRGREPVFMDHPALTIILSPQPSVVADMATKPGFRGRGLVGRFIIVMPKSRLGSRRVEAPGIPAGLEARYAAMLHRLLDLPWARDEYGEPTPYLLRLTPEAYAAWAALFETVEAELGPGGQFEYLTDCGGKFPGQIARIAGLLHMATEAEPHRTPISRATMEAALALAGPLAEHAARAYAIMGEASPAVECAKALLAWIRRERVEAFTTRDALNRVRGRFKTMAEVEPGLAELVARGFLFEDEMPAKRGRGRPSRAFKVNPLTHGGAA